MLNFDKYSKFQNNFQNQKKKLEQKLTLTPLSALQLHNRKRKIEQRRKTSR